MTRRRVALLFGGRSAEHEISVISARGIFDAIDSERYAVSLIAIGQNGRWWLQKNASNLPAVVEPSGLEISFLPGGRGRALVHSEGREVYRIKEFDVVLPVLHGSFGEDGTVQGLLEIAQVPYVGSGVLGSALCMDKQVSKRVLRDAGLPIAKFLTCARTERCDFQSAQSALGNASLFVKPARLGSSIGISKVSTEPEFNAALDLAFRYDDKVLVEESVQAREIECGVLEAANGTGELHTTWPGEIVPALSRHAFYSYEAKYRDNAGADLITRAALSQETSDRIQVLSRQVFRLLGCEGMARVDFFLKADGEALINEVNTIPGFTPFSMYPRMMQEAGVPYGELIQTLLEHAIARTKGESPSIAR